MTRKTKNIFIMEYTCGIVVYLRNIQAIEVILEWLSKIEYRGYDLEGVVVNTG